MRRLLAFFALLFVVAAVHAGAAYAANLGISGFVETKVNYTPEDSFSAQTQVQFGASTSSGKLSLSLAYYDATRKIWESHPKLDSGTYYPYSMTLTASGPWWKNGPTVTTKLGDFDMLGPSYIAGDTAWPPARQIRGVLVSDLSYQGVKLSGYFGWPKYSKTPSSSPPLPPVDPARSTLVYGGAVNVANLRGVKVDLFGAVRQGNLLLVTPKTVKAANGNTQTLTAVNPVSMSSNQLLLFTREASKRPNEVTNIWWTYVLLDKDMKVLEVRPAGTGPVPTGPNNSTAYAYVLAGHESKATWLKDNCPVRSTVQILDSANNPVDLSTMIKPYREAIYAVEAAYKLAGINLSGQWGRQVVVDPRPADSKPNQDFTAGFRTLTASTDLDILDKVMATKPLSLSLAYRNIDKDFVPWAALKDSSSNPIYGQRDQRGFKLTASTTVFPDNPVDVSLELDTYSPVEQTDLGYEARRFLRKRVDSQ